MSGAQSWSVKGIDPKVREAAREAAARQGMTLGEYLNQALQNHQPGQHAAPAPQPPAQRLRSARLAPHPYDEEEEDWHITGPLRSTETLPRITDPVRLGQRIDAIERRTQLAVTGLDRAVSTIDRSVLGLAARIDDAETTARESADRIGDAIEQFRAAGDLLGGRLETAEAQVGESKHALDSAKLELGAARERLESQVAAAEEIARKAEAAAQFLTNEIANREAMLGQKLGSLEDQTRKALAASLAEARAAAEEAAHHAAHAAADAFSELRQLHARLADRVEESEANTRRTVETAIKEARAEQAVLAERVAHTEANAHRAVETGLAHARAEQAALAERIARNESDARTIKETVLEEVVRLESEIGARAGTAESLRAEQAALISRIEKAEAHAREATAGLRQAAGAAISDLRNAQLSLTARLKQVEEGAGRAGAIDLADVRASQAEIAARLGALEGKPSFDSALAAFERRIEEIETRTEQRPGEEAFAAFEQRLQELAAKNGAVAQEKLDEVGASVKTLDENLQRLADRLAETETTANNAIRTLEQTVSGLSEKVAGASAAQETEALRAMLEHRLDEMAQSVSTMVGEARTEIAGQVQSVLEGGADGEGFEGALADVNRRLAAAERRQAQTIEAISIEIKRMSETVDRRLRTVENRNDDAAAVTVREELARMGQTLEQRFEEIERREAAAFDRMGLEVGRLSERLEDRVGAVETRSAQAIEHVGEQVARMAERFNQRHEILARDLGERMLDSEERSGARVSEAISSIMQRLGEVEERSAEAVAPVQKAVSSIASRLEGLAKDEPEEVEADIPSPSRRFDDLIDTDPFEAEPYTPPIAFTPPPVEQAPLRAAPLPPLMPVQPTVDDDDIYFAEDIEALDEPAPEPAVLAPTPAPAPLDLAPVEDFTPPQSEEAHADTPLVFDDPFADETDALAPPPEDNDPFWTPDAVIAESELAPAPSPETAAPEADDDIPPPPPGRHDYLKAARAAAQAASTPAPKSRHEPVLDTPTYSLKGSSRIVLWGAASAIALLIAGGAWYMNARDHARHAAPTQPEPEAPPPTAALPPPAQTYDPAAATDATAAPDATTDADAVTPPTAAPVETTAAPPVAQATPQTTQQASAQRAAPTRVAAGPLPPRAVSLDQAAQGGDLVAQYELALQRIAAGRTTDGVSLLRRAADHGMVMAQYRLAKIYERGEGVPVDLTQARQWTERAAAGGNRRAMHDLGVYFARGEGASMDEAAAFRWFRQAAELGVADSQYNLGVLYQQGRGVGASASEALFWFLVAARQGDPDASSRASTLESQLTPAQVQQAHTRAEAFRPRAVSGPANGEFGPRPWSTTPPRPGA